MYILIEHDIHEPERFWAGVQEAIPASIPPGLTLHHTLPTPDGAHCVCVWEGPSVDAVREFLEPKVRELSTDRYHEVENREGIHAPTRFATTVQQT